MPRSNRIWLPVYCNPEAYLPKIQETRTLFAHPPYLFQDFVARAYSFLQSKTAKSIGFDYNEDFMIPCKWKCSDESVFGVDLSLYAHTGQYPFNKGEIGGLFNDKSITAAIHHGPINVDFGGSHVGYIPDEFGGKFGSIWRPQCRAFTADCGYLRKVISPFKTVYEDACKRIKLFKPEGVGTIVSIPNEFIQPSWSSSHIKLLVDTEALTDRDIAYDSTKKHTHTPIGRTRFYLRNGLLETLPEEAARSFSTPKPTPIGHFLLHPFFNIFDDHAVLDEFGLPAQKLNLYMKYILSAQNSPFQLKAAIVNTNLQHNRLAVTYTSEEYRHFSFASFTGVFIDFFDHQLSKYVNLYQPIGLSIKPKGTNQITEFPPSEIDAIMSSTKPSKPKLNLTEVMGFLSPECVAEKFFYEPGKFSV